MNTAQSLQSRNNRGGFTLIEVCIALTVLLITFVALYAGLTTGFSSTDMARENLRATQIGTEKLETIRLYTWEQINTAGFIPSRFTNNYRFTDDGGANGLKFIGQVLITNVDFAASYSTNMRLVKIKLTWKRGTMTREREMQTYISRYGLQNYIY